jgi:hypothetical protein
MKLYWLPAMQVMYKVVLVLTISCHVRIQYQKILSLIALSLILTALSLILKALSLKMTLCKQFFVKSL